MSMFRHSTKQHLRSQQHLKARAVRALDDDRQVFCDSVYKNTYDMELPPSSIRMLSDIVIPLTGNEAQPSKTSRPVFTICRVEHGTSAILRACFLQPEISSATAHTKASNCDSLLKSRALLLKMENNPAPGSISKSSEKCQVAGRLSPYIVDEAGLGGGGKMELLQCLKV